MKDLKELEYKMLLKWVQKMGNKCSQNSQPTLQKNNFEDFNKSIQKTKNETMLQKQEFVEIVQLRKKSTIQQKNQKNIDFELNLKDQYNNLHHQKNIDQKKSNISIPFVFNPENKTKNLLALDNISDFMSDSEESVSQNKDIQKEINFMGSFQTKNKQKWSKDQIQQIIDTSSIKLQSIINYSSRENNCKNNFQCQQCIKSFDKASALGGHMSKKHPKISKQYQKRLFSTCIRKVERNRTNFLNKKYKK